MEDTRDHPLEIPMRNGVVVLYGYAVKVKIWQRHLICEDGVLTTRRAGRFHATAGLRRLVIMSDDGYLSLEVGNWLRSIGAALVQITRDGDVILGSVPNGPDYPKLRRAQVRAIDGAIGRDLTREIIAAKLRGQSGVLRELGIDETPILRNAARIRQARVPQTIRQLEADAAAYYWNTLAPFTVTFARNDIDAIPAHWCTIGARSSGLTHSPRRAITPAHAILNYTYRLLEAETRLATVAVGLDPGLGFFHVDQDNRDSLALDLMEAARPAVDRWWLTTIRASVFSRKDFIELTPGEVRCTRPLGLALAATILAWRNIIAPWAEWCAGSLAAGRVLAAPGDGARERIGIATHLTGHNRSVGRDGIRKRAVGTTATAAPKLDRRLCQGCGLLLSADGRRAKQRYCAECREMVREEVLRHFQAAGPATLARARSKGHDPSKTSEALGKLAATQRERAAARATWEREHAGLIFNPDTFLNEILPSLQEMPLSAIVQATGLSLYYCSLIRRGLRVPHPRYWDALAPAETCKD